MVLGAIVLGPAIKAARAVSINQLDVSTPLLTSPPAEDLANGGDGWPISRGADVPTRSGGGGAEASLPRAVVPRSSRPRPPPPPITSSSGEFEGLE